MRTADVVVIGGGVNGLSAAFNLAKLGAGKIVLVERGALASGASGKSGAIVRMHYTNAFESRLAFESLKIFQAWSDEVGGDPGWHPTGFVEIVPRGFEEELAANVRAQQEIGIRTRVVTQADLAAMFPEMFVNDIGAAAFEPDSGWADPNATAQAFAEAALALGVELSTGCEATAIVTENGRVTGVRTADGLLRTGTVLAAPGVGASRLLGPLGLDPGLFPQRSKVAIFRRPLGFRGDQPVVIDAINNAWLRADGPGLTLIGAESGSVPANSGAFDETIDSDYVHHARRVLSARFPIYRDAIMRGGWAGLYMMSPDHRPIIDQPGSVGGLYLMVGDSGSSFKTAPAIGRCLAEWIVDGAPRTADLSPFSLRRFEGENPWHSASDYGLRGRTISR